MEATQDKAFILKDKKLKNLDELYFAISELNDEEYSYYADSNHNYFADWVNYVLEDKETSLKLRDSKSRTEAIEILKPQEKPAEAVEKKEEKKPEMKQPEKIIHEKKENSIQPKPAEQKNEPKKEHKQKDTLAEIEGLKDEHEMKHYLWHHHPWEMAKEFMYGMSLGLVLGLILSRILLP